MTGRPPRGFFVTGTDTGIGKTVAASALIRYLVDRGLPCAPMKPVASGAGPVDGELRNDDALALIAAAGGGFDYEDVNPVIFPEAIAPHLAAARHGRHIEFHCIGAAFARLRERADFVVVEGVGGWLVPLGEDLDVESLARRLALPVVLVVGLRLGCINHALLTARAIEASGCAFAGWIANHTEPGFLEVAENVATIRAAVRAPLLGEVAWTAGAAASAVLDSVAAAAIDAALALGQEAARGG